MRVPEVQTSALASAGANGASSNAKIVSASREFESILLGQWLQEAESSFATVPGGDEDDDSCGEQMQGFGIQQLAKQLTASGGIGIAHMVRDALTKTSQHDDSSSAGSAHARSATDRAAAQGVVRVKGMNSAVEAYAVERKQ
jgi:Rod binding domain-containing protein